MVVAAFIYVFIVYVVKQCPRLSEKSSSASTKAVVTSGRVLLYRADARNKI